MVCMRNYAVGITTHAMYDMAVMYAMHYPNECGFYADTIEYFPEVKTVNINTYFNLKTFTDLTNYCIDDLLLLNPEIKRNVILDSLNYKLRLPIDIADSFLVKNRFYFDSCKHKGDEKLNYKPRKYKGSTDGKIVTYYKVKSGDYIAKVANKYNVTIKDIRRWNKMRSNTIYVGQKLKIWKSPSYFKNSSKKISSTYNSNTIKDIPGSKKHIVRSGDNLWDIARKYKNVSVDDLKRWNNLKTESLKIGQVLKLSK